MENEMVMPDGVLLLINTYGDCSVVVENAKKNHMNSAVALILKGFAAYDVAISIQYLTTGQLEIKFSMINIHLFLQCVVNTLENTGKVTQHNKSITKQHLKAVALMLLVKGLFDVDINQASENWINEHKGNIESMVLSGERLQEVLSKGMDTENDDKMVTPKGCFKSVGKLFFASGENGQHKNANMTSNVYKSKNTHKGIGTPLHCTSRGSRLSIVSPDSPLSNRQLTLFPSPEKYNDDDGLTVVKSVLGHVLETVVAQTLLGMSYSTNAGMMASVDDIAMSGLAAALDDLRDDDTMAHVNPVDGSLNITYPTNGDDGMMASVDDTAMSGLAAALDDQRDEDTMAHVNPVDDSLNITYPTNGDDGMITPVDDDEDLPDLAADSDNEGDDGADSDDEDDDSNTSFQNAGRTLYNKSETDFFANESDVAPAMLAELREIMARHKADCEALDISIGNHNGDINDDEARKKNSTTRADAFTFIDNNYTLHLNKENRKLIQESAVRAYKALQVLEQLFITEPGYMHNRLKEVLNGKKAPKNPNYGIGSSPTGGSDIHVQDGSVVKILRPLFEKYGKHIQLLKTKRNADGNIIAVYLGWTGPARYEEINTLLWKFEYDFEIIIEAVEIDMEVIESCYSDINYMVYRCFRNALSNGQNKVIHRYGDSRDKNFEFTIPVDIFYSTAVVNAPAYYGFLQKVKQAYVIFYLDQMRKSMNEAYKKLQGNVDEMVQDGSSFPLRLAQSTETRYIVPLLPRGFLCTEGFDGSCDDLTVSSDTLHVYCK